jgi:hypothetical protein
MMFPHDRHIRVTCAWEGCAGGGIYGGGGGEEMGSGTGAGGAIGLSRTVVPHPPQNLVPGPSGIPHTVQVADGSGTAGAGAAGAGDGAAGGDSGRGAGGTGSPSFAPQAPQNFSPGPSGFPQDVQVRVAACSGVSGVVDGSSSSCDAPQLRQNFAVGATRLPHSGQ